ncbi:hypothetical protein SUGI_0446670 [Cryptomeria japonica]|uniref:amino acid transporter AVT1H n=1 Tax=Cryptomeria japonica TaxID=3369 RepID=UPI002408C8C6|nr:amino acid transporter AVT1H [Cryptomeria japonica]GLJ23582.1 hypothetical protein SUGI_0446670 [Cryptomeria japonica]
MAQLMNNPTPADVSHLPHRNQVASESLEEDGLAHSLSKQNNRSLISEFENSSIEVYICDGNGFKKKIVEEEAAAKSNDGHHAKANSSFLQSTVNLVGIMIGLGQLSTPYALEKGGWMSGFLLVGFGIICAYTATIMGRCLKQNTELKNYQDLGQRALGSKGRIITSTFLYVEIFLALVSYTISLGDNLGIIFSNRTHLGLSWVHLPPSRFLTIIAVVMALPSLWLRDLSSLSFLSSGGIVTSLLLFFTVSWAAAFGGVGTKRSIPSLQMIHIPGISGLYIFSYAGHVVFPNIYRSMKNPSQFSKVIAVSFPLITVIYTGLAFMGATMFGSDIKSQITLNMPRHLIVTKIALWATVITPMTKYALELAPVAMQLESVLPHYLGSKSRMAIRATIGSLLLIIILIIALTLPYFSYVLALTGSLLSTCISIVFPCLFYIKICRSSITIPGMALNIVLITLGIFFGVVGTISSVQSLFESVRESHR